MSADLMTAEQRRATVERLRESRKARREEVRAMGFAAGKEWAIDQADHHELRRLKEARELHPDFDFDGVPAVVEGLDHEPNDVRLWWMEAVSNGEAELAEHDEGYVEGFVDGALAVFNAVASEV